MNNLSIQTNKMPKKSSIPRSSGKKMGQAITSATDLQLSYQDPEGYWWYTLEANETIGAEYIQLMYLLDIVDNNVLNGLIARIIDEQRIDGSWSLYYGDEGDLNATIECYFVLKLSGQDINSKKMLRAREFILAKGGLTKARVFTRIHFAMFNLLPWSVCPAMPIELVLLPQWMPVNIYEFSSWARACIIPLLVLMNKKPVKKLSPDFNLEELYIEPATNRDFQFKHNKSFLSWDNFFIQFDRWLKLLGHVPFKPMKNQAIKACEKYIIKHIDKTEDIYPAMAYSCLAMHALGHPITHPTIQKCLNGLKSFQHKYKSELTPLPKVSHAKNLKQDSIEKIHQQCCLSPVWDTPWSITALLDAGVPSDDKRLLKAGKWLISKQITEDIGDWKIKNPYGKSGGWSFEFENVFFPDVDDTIQVIHVLRRLNLPEREKKESIDRGIAWILSMQNDDGGWAAFDKNNNLNLVNKIPFSDHGACLDPSSPDITARVIELLHYFGFTKDEGVIRKALNYLYENQQSFGGWFGRWGINYIYGTWAVLKALSTIGDGIQQNSVRSAVDWLKSIQRQDGGWSESPESYNLQKYVPYQDSVPSQTAWAIMGLISIVGSKDKSVKHGIEYLINAQNENGKWEERYFTGTGFPGHFYIRYHGYSHFFPLMALGQYESACLDKNKQ